MHSKKIGFIFLILIILSLTNTHILASAPTINSQSAIAIDADSGIVLYGKSINEKVYPASTTKILTAILALENLPLDKSVVVSKTAINIPWDSSSIYLKEGEIITVKELLYGLLLDSGNDAANVLAENVSGSISEFVKLMNSKLAKLGCNNTHFVNAHGYSDPKHYTTAEDMAKLLKYCIKNDTFLEIMSTKTYTMNETNKTKTKRYFSNTNRLIQKKSDSRYARYYEYCVGGKTGYTEESGRTLVTYGKKDNKNVIVTVFNGKDINGEDTRYTDAINLFEYAFNNFEKQTIAQSGDYSFSYINLENKLKYWIYIDGNLDMLLKGEDNIYEISYSLNVDDSKLPQVIESNNAINTSVGKIKFTVNLNNQIYNIEKDLKLNKIETISIYENINYYIIIPFIVLFLFLILIMLKLKKKNSHSKFNKEIEDCAKFARKSRRH